MLTCVNAAGGSDFATHCTGCLGFADAMPAGYLAEVLASLGVALRGLHLLDQLQITNEIGLKKHFEPDPINSCTGCLTLYMRRNARWLLRPTRAASGTAATLSQISSTRRMRSCTGSSRMSEMEMEFMEGIVPLSENMLMQPHFPKKKGD